FPASTRTAAPGPDAPWEGSGRQSGHAEGRGGLRPVAQVLGAPSCVYARHRELGNITGKSKSKRGEIDAYLQSLNRSLWDEGGKLHRDNKPRRAHWFARQMLCPSEVAQIYGKLVRLLLGPDAAGLMTSSTTAGRRRTSAARLPAAE